MTPVSAESTKGLLEWVKGQPFNNLMAVALLGVISWLGYYTLTAVIPEERKAIFEGIHRVEENHTSNVKTMSETYERMLDRVSENKHENKHEKKPSESTAAK